MSDSDDDIPQLSSASLAALQEFYAEKKEREEQLSMLIEKANDPDKQKQCDIDNNITFEEDWQLSQFWYDDETIDKFVKGAIAATKPDGIIALVSCPTLYYPLKKISGERTVKLFDYDTRFMAYGNDFSQYDYNKPTILPSELENKCDLVIADPPFLSQECLTKTSISIKYLTKKNIVLSTGAIMEELANKLMNLHKCKFEPHHKNNLANEFCCYSNFNFDNFIN